MPKLFKGVIHSLLPQKGFGFITPPWGNGDNNENVFFRLADTKGKKCYIPALASSDNREEQTTGKGVTIFIPKEAQTLYFHICEGKNGKLMAINLRDEKNVSKEEKDEAETNVDKPSLAPVEETVNLIVTSDTIKAEQLAIETSNEDEFTSEEPVDALEEDDRDYDQEEVEYSHYYKD